MTIAVIYHWKITPGKETTFEKMWYQSTKTIYEHWGSFGSSLHKTKDGTYLAYARWPDHETWQKMIQEYTAEEAIETFWEEHVTEIEQPVVLDLLEDYLYKTSGNT